MVVQVGDAGPSRFVARPDGADDAEGLVDFGVAREERPERENFSDNAASAPDVDRSRVEVRTEQDLGKPRVRQEAPFGYYV